MPALVLFGQPTIVSGDDIRWVCILMILLRLLQMAVVIPFLVYVVNFSNHTNNKDYSECVEEASFSSPLVSKARLIAISYGALTLFLAISSMVLEAFIWRTSLLGTPTEPEKRQALKWLCFVKLVPGSLLRIVTMLLGLVSTIILEEFCACQLGESANGTNSEETDIHQLRDVLSQCGGNFYRVRLLLVILIISHMTEVCMAAFIHVIILFTSIRGKYHVFQLTKWILQSLCCCCCGTSTTTRTKATTNPLHHGRTAEFISNHNNNNMDGSGWRFFCSCCFTLTSFLTCCLLGGRQAATADFRDISMALVTFLDDGGHLDVTISDVLCALVVLHKQHQERRYAYIHRIKSQILIEMSSSRENHLHHGIISNRNSSGNDTHTAVAATSAAGVEPTGTRKLGSGRFDNDDEGDEHFVDLEVVMLTESMDQAQQQHHQQHGRNDANSTPVVTDNDDDLEHGQSVRVPQQAVRASTMFRWTLQRDNIDNNNFNDSNTRYQREERTLLSPTDASARFAVAAGAHFMRLALAIYGPSLLPVARPCQGSLCFLGWDACCTTPCRRRRQTKNNPTATIEVLGDNHCSCNENTLLREANLTMDDVAYATFNSSVDKNPYCIIVDRPWKSIVVAIRGSLSLESIVTDLALVPVRLVTSLIGESNDQEDAQGDPVEHEKAAIAGGSTSNGQVYCHSGMLQTSQWMYKDLQRHGILDKLLLGDSAPHADYRLVLTGHSLGAGLAAILGIMLRPKFPTLKCFCFAPPGCTLSGNALEATRVAAHPVDIKIDGGNSNCNNRDVDTKHDSKENDFITSYVVGSDIFPRMSLEAMESLRDDVLETIARIKVNKVQAMGGGGGYWGGQEKTSLEVLDLLHREESIPQTEFQEQLLAFWAHQASVREKNPIGIVKLHPPPGKMVHFVKTSTKSNRRLADSIRASTDTTASTSTVGHSSSYTAIWAERQDFSEIQLSASMLANHYPWTALAIMERIAREQFGLQEPYFVPE